MMQRFPGAASGSVAPGDTANHSFPDTPAGVAYIQAPPTNVANATIRVPGSPGGLSLTPGTFAPTFGPMQNLNQIGYQLGNSADAINFLVMR